MNNMNILKNFQISPSLPRKLSKQAGFTLIELLVVISIIGMLSSVVLVSLQSARDKGRVGAGLKFATYNYRAFGADAFAGWDFNDSTAGSTADISGNGMTANFNAGAVRDSVDRPSSSGSSISLTGTNNNIIALNSTGRKICGSGTCTTYTISVWIKPTAISGTPYIVEVGNGTARYHRIAIANGGGVINGIMCGSGSSGAMATFSQIRIELGKWQHVTCSNENGPMALYLDGRFIARSIVSLAPSVNLPVNIVAIGNYVGGLPSNEFGFNGKIDDVFIYNRSLTASEIQHIYAQSAPKYNLAVAE